MPDQNIATSKIKLHVVDAEASVRAEIVRVARSIGYHCEPYADFSELAAYPPRDGIIILRDMPEMGGTSFALDRLLSLGIWLPVVAVDYDPMPSRVVNAIKNGALDYLVLPLRPDRLAASLARISSEAAEFSAKRLRTVDAQKRLSRLSGRELQVLEALARGGSNKDIARTLEISPRTVEIHRANLMTKLGARHAVEAVRIGLDARMNLQMA